MNGSLMFRNMKAMGLKGLAAPVFIMGILAMMILPIPPFLLDMFFTFNIAMSLVVLMVAVYVMRPLDFLIFPSVLLITTLLRLALNIASTRVILMEGHSGTHSVGKVIEAFGEFVVGGNFAVGMVVFAILVIINFVVVTKGSGRISEVSARFTLDALPGKQMAIDADLNAGVINQDEARTRRLEVSQEADFYGSMDGASKFVRGDAIAGILILFVNIIGGFAIGMFQHDMKLADAIHNYTMLTIGDGLVAQIPALVLSVAAGLLVTRVSTSEDMGSQFSTQMLSNPKALGVVAVVMGAMGVIPGMPNFAFLCIAALCGAGAYFVDLNKRKADLAARAMRAASAALPAPGAAADGSAANKDQKELSWEDVPPVDPIGLEVGYGLIPLVDRNQGGQLLTRIKGVRKKLSQEIGFLLQSVHIRDNLDLSPNAYRINILGVPVGEAQIYPDREMAINPGTVQGKLNGIAGKDPAFGLEAVWITADQRDRAQSMGYTVVDASTVVATHLSQVLQENSYQLLGYEEVQKLLDMLAKQSPKLVEQLVPNTLQLSVVVKVLQNLLLERIPIRDMRTIVETLAEYGMRSQDPNTLTAQVRQAMGRHIVQHINGMAPELPVITLDPNLEQLLLKSVQSGADAGLEPGLTERILQSLTESAQRQEMAGEPAVLLTAPQIRTWISRMVRNAVHGLSVLAYTEIPDNKRVRVVASVGQARA